MLTPLAAALLLAAAPSPAAPSREALAAFAERELSELLAKHRVAGAVIALVADGELVFARGYGHRDVAAKLPVEAERTLFRVGSVSKLFVWTAVMQCVERGLIALDADVNRYLDFEIPATYAEPITMAHLMAHTPGFEDQLLGLFTTDRAQLRGLAEVMREVPRRIAPPGRFSSYSNYGAALAATIVERVTGVPFDRYVAEQIFAPLGMTRSTFAQPVPEPLAPDLSRGYELRGEELVPAPFEYVSGVYPAGSLSSTATDMARFLLAHLHGGALEGRQILAPATAAAMQQRSFGHDPRFSGLAHGFLQAPTGAGMMLYHGGDTVFFHTLALLFPERHAAFFVSANSSSAGQAVQELGKAFLARFFPGPTGRELAAAYATPAPPERFAGTYLSRRRSESDLTRLVALAMPVRVTPDGEGGLTVSSFMHPSSPRFVQIGPNLFREADGDDQVLFLEDAEGGVDAVVLGLMPVMTFGRPAFADQPWLAALIAGAVLLLSLSIWLLPPAGLVARLRRRTRPTGELRLAAWGSLLLGLANLAFVAAFTASFSGGMLAVLTDSPLRRAAVLIPWLCAALGLAVLVLGVRAWRRRAWGLPSCLHVGALALSSLLFVWWLAHWRVLA